MLKNIFTHLNKKRWSNIDKRVKACQRKGAERATVAVVLVHAQSGKHLFVASIRDGPCNPGILKGGIRKGEEIRKALVREINEEAGIHEGQIHVTGHARSFSVLSTRRKNGYRTKRYFPFLVVYNGPFDLKINNTELAGYDWVSPEDTAGVLSILRGVREQKYHALMGILNPKKKKKRKSNTKTRGKPGSHKPPKR